MEGNTRMGATRAKARNIDREPAEKREGNKEGKEGDKGRNETRPRVNRAKRGQECMSINNRPHPFILPATKCSKNT